QGTIGLLRAEQPVGEADVRGLDLHQMRGDAGALLDDLGGGEVERRPRDGRRSRAAGAFAEEDAVGVARDVAYFDRAETEPFAYQLGEGRLVPLALAEGTAQNRRG